MQASGQTQPSAEIGSNIFLGPSCVNYHDWGSGNPLLLIHGSGPGVTAWANWRGVLPPMSRHMRVIAPDMLGFGYTRTPPGLKLDLDAWVLQIKNLLDALHVNAVSVVGNSFGGGVALALAARYPERVQRLVLMGSVGLSFPLTEGLDKVWGYQPSLAAMRELMMRYFTYDPGIITEELVSMRYAASIRADVQQRFEQLFPKPRQNGIEMLAQNPSVLQQMRQPTLVIHGRNDSVIPLELSERLAALMPRADLHVFSRCGHWVQIERQQDFVNLVSDFLTE